MVGIHCILNCSPSHDGYTKYLQLPDTMNLLVSSTNNIKYFFCLPGTVLGTSNIHVFMDSCKNGGGGGMHRGKISGS